MQGAAGLGSEAEYFEELATAPPPLRVGIEHNSHFAGPGHPSQVDEPAHQRRPDTTPRSQDTDQGEMAGGRIAGKEAFSLAVDDGEHPDRARVTHSGQPSRRGEGTVAQPVQIVEARQKPRELCALAVELLYLDPVHALTLPYRYGRTEMLGTASRDRPHAGPNTTELPDIYSVGLSACAGHHWWSRS